MFVTNKLVSLTAYHHMIHVLNQHDARSAWVHDLLTLTVCLEVTL